MDRRRFVSLAGLAAALPVAQQLETSAKQCETSAKQLETSHSPFSVPGNRAIEEPARTTPVVAEADVVVCGGGPAGVTAAIAAARHGAKTLLLETHGCLGGIWTAGLLSYLLDTENKPGILREILERVARAAARTPGAAVRPATCCDPEALKIILERMCAEAGVAVQYHSRVCGAVVNRSGHPRVTHVVAESKSGREAFAGKVFIDCTGDGDVGALAGCRFAFGHPQTGLGQPMSMICLLTGLVPSEVTAYFRGPADDWSGPKERLRAEMEKGGRSPSYAKPSLFKVRDDLFLLMANHEYGVRGTSARDVTAATLRARDELHQLIDGLRSLGGAWRNVRIVATGEQIGVREGRRIAGLYEITADDLREGRCHPDAVCQVTFPIDVHALDPKKEKGIEKAAFRAKPYDIPLRSLIARDVRGLMMAGRCISGDFLAHSSYRVTGNASAMGEAAGRVAAAAVRTGCLPEEVPFPPKDARDAVRTS